MRSSASFSPQSESVRAARYWASTVLRSCLDAEALTDAELCLSELAANAVRHARTDFEVEIIDGEGGVRLSVRDQNFRPVRKRTSTSNDVTGRGLAIVEAVADDWGVINGPHGKVVWCTVGTHRRPERTLPA